MSFLKKLFGSKQQEVEQPNLNPEVSPLAIYVSSLRGIVVAYYNHETNIDDQLEKMKQASILYEAMNPGVLARFNKLSPRPPFAINLIARFGDDRAKVYNDLINEGADVWPQCSCIM